jgi:hypothetical protein
MQPPEEIRQANNLAATRKVSAKTHLSRPCLCFRRNHPFYKDTDPDFSLAYKFHYFAGVWLNRRARRNCDAQYSKSTGGNSSLIFFTMKSRQPNNLT